MKYPEPKQRPINHDYFTTWNIGTREIGVVFNANPTLQNSQTPAVRVAQVVGTSFALDIRKSLHSSSIER